MTDLPPDLPRWCVETPLNLLRAMAYQERPLLEVQFLGRSDRVYWSDLIKAAEERETAANVEGGAR